MPLQVLLGWLTIHFGVRGKIIPSKEQGEHGGTRQLDRIGAPDHPGVRPGMGGMHDGSTGLGEVGEVKPDGFKRPTRGAIPTREAAPDILVRVDEQVEAIFACFVHHLYHIVEIFLIIDTRSSVLDGFPGHQQAQEIKTPLPQPSQVLIRLMQRKRTSDKGDVAVFTETLTDMSSSIRLRWDFTAATQVDPVQHHSTVEVIYEMRFVCMEVHGCSNRNTISVYLVL